MCAARGKRNYAWRLKATATERSFLSSFYRHFLILRRTTTTISRRECPIAETPSLPSATRHLRADDVRSEFNEMERLRRGRPVSYTCLAGLLQTDPKQVSTSVFSATRNVRRATAERWNKKWRLIIQYRSCVASNATRQVKEKNKRDWHPSRTR